MKGLVVLTNNLKKYVNILLVPRYKEKSLDHGNKVNQTLASTKQTSQCHKMTEKTSSLKLFLFRNKKKKIFSVLGFDL